MTSQRAMNLSRTIVRRVPKVDVENLNVHPVLRQVYRNRDISHPSELDYSLSKLLAPTSLSNIDEAAQIIADAIQADAAILIAGDYDADGATGSALGYLTLKAFGARKVQYLCPDRHAFGYGLTDKFVEFFAPTQPDLVITVDNGITSIAGVQLAKEFGMSVVITDHHLPGDELPQADAIVNPRLPGDRFPSKNLAGVGVMFYVMATVRSQLKQTGWFANEGIAMPNMADYLDLVALGTIADVVPLDYNNRILVAQGLKRINANRCRFGIRCLLEEGGKKIGEITSEDLAFVAGPRLNAAGRLDDISHGIKCLVSDDQSAVLQVIQKLERLNNERKELESDMVESAKREIEHLESLTTDTNVGVCLYNSNWHQGIVGLIASRIREMTGMPTFIFAPGNEGALRGSGRSIKGINLRDVLANIASSEPDIFLQYGGHAMAAGLTLKESSLARFKTAFQDELARQLDESSLANEILSDGEIDQFDLEAAEHIRQGGPWGQKFEVPVFDGVFEVVNYRLLKDEHLKVRLRSQLTEALIDGIFFRYSTFFESLPDQRVYQMAYQLMVNHYNGRKSPQLNLVHMIEHTPTT